MPEQDLSQTVLYVSMTAEAAGNLNALLDQFALKGARNKFLVSQVQQSIAYAAQVADEARENPPEASPADAEGDAAPPAGDST